MTGHKLLSGKSMAQPFESKYSRWRRFLVANAAIPITSLESELRRQMPRISGAVQRALALENTETPQPFFDFMGTIQRQCPNCSLGLYHTNIYELPWLTRCPIHHCKFVQKCSVCKRPWPSFAEMGRRFCKGCGRTSIRELAAHALPMSQREYYDPIGRIYQFIGDGIDTELDLDFINVFGWWREASTFSSIFPAYRLDTASHPLSENELNALHIQVEPCQKQKCSIGKKQIHPYYDSNLTSIERFNRMHDSSMGVHSHKFRAYEYPVFKRVLAWISSSAGHDHLSHISSYRHMGINCLAQEPRPCQYCLALSLWFFHFASIKYPEQFHLTFADFPFLWHSGYQHFLSPPHKTLLRSKALFGRDQYYASPLRFSKWVYQRSLLFGFVDLFRIVGWLIKNLQTPLLRTPATIRANEPLPDVRAQGSQYILYREGRNLTLYSRGTSPVDDAKPISSEPARAACRIYRHFFETVLDPVIPFDVDVPVTLTSNQYLELLTCFDAFIKTQQPLYSEGHHPLT